MVHWLVLCMICSVMVAEYLVDLLGLPVYLNLLPEMSTFIAVLIVVISGTQHRFRFVAGHYWLAFGLLAFTLVSGVLANHVATGPIIGGMRIYLRAIPFFFLPAVFHFSDRQIKQQLGLLLILGLAQVPIAVYQRKIVMDEFRYGGDSVSGTLDISTILSVFLISAVCVLVGLALRNQVSKWKAVILSFVLLVPTTINETKGTVVLLPLSLLMTIWISAQPSQRLRVAIWAATLFVGFGAMFVPIYDYMNKNNPYPVPITEFFTDRERIENYVDNENAGVGAPTYLGRQASLRVSFDYITRDPVRLALGLGMGSISTSKMGERFAGEYYELFKFVIGSSASAFLVETGLLGSGLILLLYWLIFRDTVAVARCDEGLRAALAAGWTGVVLVFALATFYDQLHIFPALSYLFWYVSGIIAASRMRLAPAVARSAEQRDAAVTAFHGEGATTAAQRIRS